MKKYILTFLLVFGGVVAVFGQATFTWTGAADDGAIVLPQPVPDWNNGDNWDQSGAIPSAVDSVIIPDLGGLAPNYPEVNINAVCSTITINGGNGLGEFTILAGNSLTVGGDFNISVAPFTNAATGTLSIGGNMSCTGGAIDIGGLVNLTGGTGTAISGSAVTFSGTLTNDHGMSSDQNVTIGTFVNNNTADFDANLTISTTITNTSTINVFSGFTTPAATDVAGTVVYDGTTTQAINANISSFVNLTNDNSSGAGLTAASALVVNGTLDNNQILDCNANLSVSGGSSDFDNTGGTLNFSGTTFLCDDDATIEGTVLFDGTAEVFTGNGLAVSFETLQIGDFGDNAVSFTEDVTITTSLTIASGETMDCNGDLTLNSDVAANSGTITIANDLVNDKGSELSINGFVTFDGGATSNITTNPVSFSGTVNNNNTLISSQNLTFTGTFDNDNTADLSGNLTLNGSSDFDNTGGTLNFSGTTFTCSNDNTIEGSVIFDGLGESFVGDGSAVSFTTLELDNTGTRTITFSEDVTVTTLLTVDALATADFGGNLTIGTAITNAGTVEVFNVLDAPATAIGGTVIFDGTAASQAIDTDITSFNNLTNNNTDVLGLTAAGALVVNGTLDNNQILDCNANLSVTGGSSDFDNTGGTLNFSGTTFLCDDDATIEGTVLFDGTGESFTGDGTSVSFATLELDNTGTRTIIFSDAVTIETALTIDALATADFNGDLILNTTSITNTGAMTIATDLILGVGGISIGGLVTFDAGTSNITTNDVTFSGTVTNSNGLISGQGITVTGTFDNDATADLSGNLTLNGGSSDFDNDGGTLNFSGTTFTCSDDATIEGTVIFDGSGESFVGDGSAVSFATLEIDDTGDRTVAFAENVTVTTALTVDAGETGDFNGNLIISTAITNVGTVEVFNVLDAPATAIGGTVIYDGTAASQAIDTDITSFNNLTNNNEDGAGLTAAGPLVVNGTLDNNELLDCNANLSVTGGSSSLDNTGGTLNFSGTTFTCDNDQIIEGIVLFDGTGESFVGKGVGESISFATLQIGDFGNNAVSFTEDVTVTTALSVATGETMDCNGGLTLNANPTNSGTITIANDLVNGKGSILIINGTVIFDGSGSSSITTNPVTFSETMINTDAIVSNVAISVATFTNNNTADFNGNLISIGSITSTAAITIAGDLINNSGGTLTIANSVTFDGGATSNITSDTLNFTGTMTNTDGLVSAVAVTADAFVNDNTADFDGDLTIVTSIANNDSINVATSFDVPAATPLTGTIVYDGSVVQTIDADIPSFVNLTNNNTEGVNGLNRASGALAVSGTLDNNGLFDCDADLTITGTIDNTGQNILYNATNLTTSDLTIEGSILFDGTTSTITDGIQFTNVRITGALTAPSTLFVSGSFDNDGTFNHGSGTVTFNGGGVQTSSGGNATTFNNFATTGASTTVTATNVTTASAISVGANSSLEFSLAFDADHLNTVTNNGTITFNELTNADDVTLDFGVTGDGLVQLGGTYDFGASTNHSFNDLTLTATGDYATLGLLTVNGELDTETNGGDLTLKVLTSGPLEIAGELIQGDSITVNANAVINVQRHGNNNFKEFTYWSSPVSSAIPSALFATSLSSDFYYYDPGNVTSPDSMEGWTAGNIGQAMDVGRGYAITPSSGFDPELVGPGQLPDTYVFAGIPNNGTKNFPVETNGNLTRTFNLAGNPYPSSVSVTKLVNGNSGVVANGLYLWDADVNAEADGEYVFANSGGIASGQGFMIQAIGTGNLQFKNHMRGGGNSNFYRVAPSFPKFDVNVSTGKVQKVLYFQFNTESTRGYDAFWDPANINSRKHLQSYSLIENEPGEFVAQGLGELDTIVRIPIGIDSYDSLQVTIEAKNISLFDETMKIMLLDKEEQVTHDLTNDGAYQTILSYLGVHRDRFELFVFPSTIGITEHYGTNKPELVGFSAYQNEDGLVLGGFEGNIPSQVYLVDINGRVIQSWNFQNHQKEYRLSLPEMIDGMYFVQVITEKGKMGVQKMILH